MKLTLKDMTKAVAGGHSAIRCITKLQPAGGAESKLFPPTYMKDNEGGQYAFEEQRKGEEITERAVILDSVPSQANRIEEALQKAIDEKKLALPLVIVDIAGHGRVTSLEAPHRISDAIFRDSELKGVPFRDTDEGKAFATANTKNATALYQLCPTALVFGTWDSTGASGGLGNKFARTLVSEVIGFHAEIGKKTASRLDPLGIPKVELLVNEKNPADYTVDFDSKAALPTGMKKGKPSDINHGNVAPSLSEGGVRISHAIQTSVLSLPGLRRLRFSNNGATATTPEMESAARTVLTAIALVGLTLQREQGYDFRSRCQLIPETEPEFELIGATAGDVETFKLTSDEAIALLNEAVAAAEKAGIKWRKEPLALEASQRLRQLVAKARQARFAGE